MRFFFLFLSLTVLSRCVSKKDPFDTDNYILVGSDSADKTVGSKTYVYKYDTLRKMHLQYDNEGLLMARMFSYKGKLDGKQVTYDLDGKTIGSIDSFSNGTRITSQKFYEADTSVKFYKNGKEVKHITLEELKN